MAEAGSPGPEDAFRLARLRLVRLPPEFVAVPGGGKKPVTVPIKLAIGVTDDYGTDIDMFDSLELTLRVIDADTLAPASGVSLQLSPTSSPSSAVDVTFTPSRGPFHTLKLALIFSLPSPTRPWPTRLSFRLSVASPSASAASPPAPSVLSRSAATRMMRNVVGESEQSVLETWDDKRYIFLSARSGPVEVRVQGKEVKVASSKVQTALRTLDLTPASPSSATTSSEDFSTATVNTQTITIVERPGLNNSTGQRLWDCAIGLSAFFSLHPDALDASLPVCTALTVSSLTSNPDSDALPTKKPRLNPSADRTKQQRRKVIDLGAGCALASMAVRRLTADEGVEVLATDVAATVETTLRENLVVNGEEQEVEAEVLDWGELDADRVAELFTDSSGRHPDSLTLIGSDILYNPSSHGLLLSTLLSFLRPSSSPRTPPPTRALIAYKRRTEGDDAFFPLASNAGLEVKKVWEWGEVGVWCFQ